MIRGQKVMIDEDLAELDGVQRKLSTRDKYFKVVFDEFKKLTHQLTPSAEAIGFKKSNQP